MDVNNVPVGNIVVIPRYGSRSIPIFYSYDNISYTEFTTGSSVHTSSTGVLYLYCAVSGNIQVNVGYNWNASPYNWNWQVGTTKDVYYKIEGELRVLCNKNTDPTTFRSGIQSFYTTFSDYYANDYGWNVARNNQIMDANIILPTNNSSSSQNYIHCFGSTLKNFCCWKDYRCGDKTCTSESTIGWHEQGCMFGYKWERPPIPCSLQNLQIDAKSWCSCGYGKWGLHTQTPTSTNMWIPNELSETYGDSFLQTGYIIKRYNVDVYSLN